MTSALALVVALSLPAPTPDLQVEASTSTGVPFPELADAVARALVAGGARVVLRSPTSAPCSYCARVSIVETAQADCRIDVSQDGRSVSATLRLPRPSTLFDRARAIAIQARFLVSWDVAQARTKAPSPSTVERKAARKRSSEPLPTTKSVNAETPELEHRSTDDFAPIPPVVAPPAADVHVPAPVPSKVAEAKPGRLPREPAAQPKNGRENVAKRLAPAPAVQRLRWPWIPIITGSAAAAGAGICALVARDRYNALSDKSQPFPTAQSTKNEGEHWQLASFILSGVAVVGLTTGMLGFGMRSSSRTAPTAWATPVHGGAVVSLAGALP